MKSISWIPVQSVQQAGAGRKSGGATVANDISRHVSGDGPPLPFFVQYDHVKVRTLISLPNQAQSSRIQSDFVSVQALLSLAKLPSHLRPCVLHYYAAIRTHGCCRYVQPYLGSFFSLPVKRQSGERLSHEEVVDQLDEQTVFYEVSLGTSGMFPEMLRVTIRVEVAKYELAVAWLRDLLYGGEFTKERYVLFPSCLAA